jgi:hypothetical protein
MKTNLIPLLLLGLLSLSACATGHVETQLDDKVAHENTVKSRADLRLESDRLIATAPGLKTEQRTQLMALRDSTRRKSNLLRAESLRLRAVLIQDLMAPDFSAAEVALVKKKLTDVEHERLQVFFSSIHGINTVLGRFESRQAKESADLYDMMTIEMTDQYYL